MFLRAFVRERRSERERKRENEREMEVYGPVGPYRAIARADDRFPRGAFHGDPRRSTDRA